MKLKEDPRYALGNRFAIETVSQMKKEPAYQIVCFHADYKEGPSRAIIPKRTGTTDLWNLPWYGVLSKDEAQDWVNYLNQMDQMGLIEWGNLDKFNPSRPILKD